MMERTVGEGLTGGVGSQISSESERFSDWKVSSDAGNWGTRNGGLVLNLTSLLSQTRVDGTANLIGAGNFDQEEWFLKGWLGPQLASVENSSGGWDQLTTTSMDGIWVQGSIQDVDSHASNTLVAQNTGIGDNLESGNHGVLDFVHELATFSSISDNIWALAIWTKRPDLQSLCLVPVVFDKFPNSLFWVTFHGDDTVFDIQSQFFGHWLGVAMESVMFVGGF